MSQMVLPQNLPNKAPSEAANASGAASRSASEKSGESSFDAVSRSEQKRLEAKETQDRNDARQADQKREADRSARADAEAARAESGNADARKSEAEQSQDAKTADGKATSEETAGEERGQKLAAEEPDSGQSQTESEPLPESVVADSVPLTFAELQSLVAPTQPQVSAASASGNAQGLPFVQNSMLSMAGMNGGRNGAMVLQSGGQNGPASGAALAESLLAGVTAEGGKASDSPILQNAIRFQGALESVGPQANAVNTPKLAPDAPVLRGYTTSIDVPVSHAEWGDKVAGKLTWLTARNMSVAEIHLTPPDMGPMEVRVQVQQDQANITVHSANPAVRDQLELHSHRLRDMLSEQGFSLEQFDVSDSGRDQTGEGETGGGERAGQGMMADADQEDPGAEPRSLDLTWKGEVDIFA